VKFLFRRKAAPEPTPPDLIRRIVTDGFASSKMERAEVFFVEAEKHDDGKYVLYATNKYVSNGGPGFRRQILTEHFTLLDALETMEEWERLSRTQYAINGQPTGRAAPHYRSLAKQLGTPVGPEMTSQQHARRMKHVIAARRRSPTL